MKRFLNIGCLIMALLVVLFLVASVFVTCEMTGGNAPSRGKAEYSIRTSSRIYYTDDYTVSGDTTILHGYYEKRQGKWRRNKTDLILTEKGYGDIVITKRGK